MRNLILNLILIFLVSQEAIPQDYDYLESYQNTIKSIRAFDFNAINGLEQLNEKKTNPIAQLKAYNGILQTFGVKPYLFEELLDLDKALDNDLERATYLLTSGLYKVLYEYGQEEQALKKLNLALEMALALNSKVLVCEISKAILIYHDRFFTIQDYPDYYLEIYRKNVYDPLEKKIFLIFKLDLDLFFDKNLVVKEELLQLENQVENIEIDYYKAYAYKTLGIYYDKWGKQLNKALTYHKKGLEIIADKTYGRAQALEAAILINIAVVYFGLEKYDEAITQLHRIHINFENKTADFYNAYKLIWLSHSYKNLAVYDSALYYLTESRNLRNTINEVSHTTKTAKLRIEKETDAKEKAITNLDREKGMLETKFYTILPILGIVSVILLITFWLYQKYKKRSSTLETEKSETLQKLDELKNIVIKNHIVLKDKTKIYISDLMYIKSDDHYLNIYTSDTKSYFVRGKLGTIREELPPNFIQCHRSYIVNRNFVKRINKNALILIDKTEVPLSRSYKDKF